MCSKACARALLLQILCPDWGLFQSHLLSRTRLIN